MRLALLASLAILLAGCQAVAGDEYLQIGPDQYDALAARPGVTVIDVHIPEQEHLPGTDEVIAYTDTQALLDALPDKDAPVVLYCRSGSMSAQTAAVLVENGYTQVYELQGGRNAYVQEQE